MKKILLLSALAFCLNQTFAQGFVIQNPSFEDTIQGNFAPPDWDSCSPCPRFRVEVATAAWQWLLRKVKCINCISDGKINFKNYKNQYLFPTCSEGISAIKL
jgi:hypothetical protein